MPKNMGNKKIYFTVAIALLLNGIIQSVIFVRFSLSDTGILPIVYLASTGVFLLCSLLLFIRLFFFKNAKGQLDSSVKEEPAIETPLIEESCTSSISRYPLLEIALFDQLEKELLDVKHRQSIYDIATKWLMNKQNSAYAAISLIAENGTLNIKAYFENAPSNEIFASMVMIRTERIDFVEILSHDCGGFSIPFFKRGTIEGFIFVGTAQSTNGYIESDYAKLNPFVRILSTALLVADAIQIKKEKNQLQYAFSRYISPDMVNMILENPDLLKLGGEKQNLTVIFTDLRDFTLMSDSMDPIVLVRILNMYLNEMSEVIIALGGTIDKFEGDAILAFFGAPTPLENHAVLCCRAALRMKKMEEILNTQLMAEKLISTPLFTRFGINTGEMIVGNIGSLKRLDYTIIGSNVNLASRIETANKEYGTSLLVSDQTWRIVKDSFEGRYVDTVHLKGVKRPVPLFELLSERVTEDVERKHFANDVAALMNIDVEELFETDDGKINIFAPQNSSDLEELEELGELEELEE